MKIHPINPPASPTFVSPFFDALFDSIESRTNYFALSVLPIAETTTVTEVALGYHRSLRYKVCGPSSKQYEGERFIDPDFEEK